MELEYHPILLMPELAFTNVSSIGFNLYNLTEETMADVYVEDITFLVLNRSLDADNTKNVSLFSLKADQHISLIFPNDKKEVVIILDETFRLEQQEEITQIIGIHGSFKKPNTGQKMTFIYESFKYLYLVKEFSSTKKTQNPKF